MSSSHQKKESTESGQGQEPGSGQASASSRASEMMKRAVTVGLGTFFLTEESLRGMVSELKLPKEILGGVLESATRTKNDLVQNLSQEVLRRIMERVDPLAFVQEILSRNELELSVRISFKPKNGGSGGRSSSEEARPQPQADQAKGEKPRGEKKA